MPNRTASGWPGCFLVRRSRTPKAESVGDINDLVFDRTGKINTVVLGVGGFLGLGEKTVAVPFTALSFNAASDGARQIIVGLSKNDLMHAPTFQAVEKTTLDNVREIAVGLGNKASETVVGLKDQAVKKIGEMNKDAPKAP